MAIPYLMAQAVKGLNDIDDKEWEKMKRDITDASKKREQMMLRGVGKGGVEWMQSRPVSSLPQSVGGAT